LTIDHKITAGIDIGSRTTKAVIWDGSKVLSRSLLATGWTPERSAQAVLGEALQESGLEKVDKIVSTGFGRVTCAFADETITEITAHARGVGWLLPHTRTLIDIGGQDSKAIVMDYGGIVTDFAMNDRCAAGSGKFLEFLAGSLELSVAEFAKLAFKSQNPVKISSICTVFAESEALSLLAEGISREDIARGIHRAIAQRVAQMAGSLHPKPPMAFTGGVAKNLCMRKELSRILHSDIAIPENPEFTGALGAAILAWEE
jgi:predicted CoA-substrate-specific enzyme activase